MGDPTEGALLAAGKKAGLSQSKLSADMGRLDSIPFESEFQYMATLHDGSPRVIYVKGSVEAILRRCEQMWDRTGETIAINARQIEQAVEEMASKGLRVLAFAQKQVGERHHSVDHEDLETGLVFIGLQGMIDPPRPEAIAAVKECHAAGIQVKMITGDHISTARAIAQRMSIDKGGRVTAFEGRDLEKMDATALTKNLIKLT